MKNKLEADFMASEQFSEVLAMDQRSLKVHRESIAPKIVVCPPMEEVPEPTSITRRTKLFKALSRKLVRRSADDDSQGSSSSNESMSSDRNDSSCSVSDSGSDGSDRRSRHRSIASLRRMFQSFSITPRSQSCSPTVRQRQPKKQQQPQRILRSPVTYTYVRGLSGLPTQRVPRHTVGCAR